VREAARIAVKMMLLASSGHCPNHGLRIDHNSEPMVYATMKTTMAIFHLDSGATTVFKSGTANHVSRPVAVS
jgi:hypothetical protein